MTTTPDPQRGPVTVGNPEEMEQPIRPGDDERGRSEERADNRPAFPDSPGTPGGTAGTGGENKVQDSQFER